MKYACRYLSVMKCKWNPKSSCQPTISRPIELVRFTKDDPLFSDCSTHMAIHSFQLPACKCQHLHHKMWYDLSHTHHRRGVSVILGEPTYLQRYKYLNRGWPTLGTL